MVACVTRSARSPIHAGQGPNARPRCAELGCARPSEGWRAAYEAALRSSSPAERQRQLDRARGLAENSAGEEARVALIQSYLHPDAFSDDDSLSLSTAEDLVSKERGVSLISLAGSDRGAVLQFWPLSLGTEPLLLTSERAFTYSSTTGLLSSHPLSGGAATTFTTHTRPVRWRSGWLTTDDKDRPVLLDLSTLAPRWTSTEVLASSSVMIVVPETADRALFADETRSLLIDAGGKVVASAPLGASEGLRLSRSSRYMSVSFPSASPLVGISTVLYDLTQGREIFRDDGRMFPASIAFAADESFAVAGTEPSRMAKIELPSGKVRAFSNGRTYDSEGYGYMVQDLAVTADGRFVCGHPVTTIGKYTSCNTELLFDLRQGGRVTSRPGVHTRCFADGDGATLVHVPLKGNGITASDRAVIMDSSATYTRLCNHASSPDKKRIALVEGTAPSKADPLRQSAFMAVIDAATGKPEQTFPLGEGYTAMSAVLSSSFSRSGRYLSVDWGGNLFLYDLAKGAVIADAAGATLSRHDRFALLGSELLELETGARFSVQLHADSTRERDRIALGGGASLVLAPSGHFALAGPDAERIARERLRCRAGSTLMPFEVCRERDQVP